MKKQRKATTAATKFPDSKTTSGVYCARHVPARWTTMCARGSFVCAAADGLLDNFHLITSRSTTSGGTFRATYFENAADARVPRARRQCPIYAIFASSDSPQRQPVSAGSS